TQITVCAHRLVRSDLPTPSKDLLPENFALLHRRNLFGVLVPRSDKSPRRGDARIIQRQLERADTENAGDSRSRIYGALVAKPREGDRRRFLDWLRSVRPV